jgi:hypothetical protein
MEYIVLDRKGLKFKGAKKKPPRLSIVTSIDL